MASSSLKPLDLYYHGPSPNPFKVAIILEELGLPWAFKDVPEGNVKSEAFVALNPNGRAPALVDPNQNITLWESGAIIDYLVAEYDPEGKLQYLNSPEKYVTRSWEHFQMSGQGPYFGQSGWFQYFHHEKLPSAIERYINEIRRVTGVIDAHLAKQKTDYLVGDRVTYADFMFLPYYWGLVFFGPGVDIADYPAFKAWYDRLNERPAVTKIRDIQTKLAAEKQKERLEQK